jgi:hypothetical protein
MTARPAGYDALSEQILAADYRNAATTFCGLVREEEPVRDLVMQSIDAAAPFVQSPSHLMQKPDGSIRGVNYDHTILGWRSSLKIAQRMGGRPAHLPLTQAIWYAPQGLSVWDQLLCDFPGHYARDQEQCDAREHPPEAGPYDGPAWTPPKVHFDDHEPITDGTPEDRIRRMTFAFMEGRREESYGLFLGLADEPEHRKSLKDAVLFAGIIDLQDTLVDRAAYQNIGHKALRARAMCDIADDFGWDNAHSLFYTVIPDLGTSPRLHALWSTATNLVNIQFPNAAAMKHENVAPMSERELDESIDIVLWGQQGDVLAHVSRLLREGKSFAAIADATLLAYCRYVTDVVEHPNALFTPGHAWDYCNVVNSWIRNYDNPHQVKGLYFQAAFVNDVIRANRQFPQDPAMAIEPSSRFRDWADGHSLDLLLVALDEAILAQDPSRTLALVDSYLERTGERQKLLSTIVFSACRFQNDPHVQRHAITALEEYERHTTSRRDEIIRAAAKYAARCIKRSLAMEAFDLYTRSFASD